MKDRFYFLFFVVMGLGFAIRDVQGDLTQSIVSALSVIASLALAAYHWGKIPYNVNISVKNVNVAYKSKDGE